MVKDVEEIVENMNYRQVSLQSLNSTINLTSTHKTETIDFLLERAVGLLRLIEEKNNGD